MKHIHTALFISALFLPMSVTSAPTNTGTTVRVIIKPSMQSQKVTKPWYEQTWYKGTIGFLAGLGVTSSIITVAACAQTNHHYSPAYILTNGLLALTAGCVTNIAAQYYPRAITALFVANIIAIPLTATVANQSN